MRGIAMDQALDRLEASQHPLGMKRERAVVGRGDGRDVRSPDHRGEPDQIILKVGRGWTRALTAGRRRVSMEES
jgi:hypothetical protein